MRKGPWMLSNEVLAHDVIVPHASPMDAAMTFLIIFDQPELPLLVDDKAKLLLG